MRKPIKASKTTAIGFLILYSTPIHPIQKLFRSHFNSLKEIFAYAWVCDLPVLCLFTIFFSFKYFYFTRETHSMIASINTAALSKYSLPCRRFH